MENNQEIAIVLTGTILPNTIMVMHNNIESRKREYLNALNYYSAFAKVYFLENSEYDLNSDSSFQNLNNVIIRKMPVSKYINKGKGFQEFEMIDKWVQGEKDLPVKFIKITGRYIIENFQSIFIECQEEKRYPIIIDTYFQRKIAITAIFCIESAFYLRWIKDIYKECDDEKGKWIEKVLYEKMQRFPLNKYSIFYEEPMIRAISGSTGNQYIKTRGIKKIIKLFMRRINWFYNRKKIYY